MFRSKFSSIPSIIKEAKKGNMFILVDDKNRENEGDLVVPGSKCNSKIIKGKALEKEVNFHYPSDSLVSISINETTTTNDIFEIIFISFFHNKIFTFHF